MLLHAFVYTHIVVFWLVFASCSTSLLPWWGELPTNPRKLYKTTECNCNIGQILLHLASMLDPGAQGNMVARRDCIRVKKAKQSCNPRKKKVAGFLMRYFLILF